MKEKVNVLLIDDSKAINHYNRQLLTEMSWAQVVQTCSGGKEGLKFLKDNMNRSTFPDIIFLDLLMPEMSGFSFLEKYTELATHFNEANRPIVVILSDHVIENGPEKPNWFLKHGILEQLHKPLENKKLDHLVEKYF